MRLPIVVHLVGGIFRFFGMLYAAPAGVALLYGERRDALMFVAVGLVTTAAGQVAMWVSGRRDVEDMRRLEALAVVAFSWLAVAVSAAAPYALSGFGPIDALFESMSGLTTTGATVMRDFSAFGRGIFFWRALTHWVGGMGVIALFVAILPRFGIGGRQLFFAEAPGPTEEKLTPQIRKTAAALWAVYAALTFAEIAALTIAGMPLYDSVCNAFATLAAGGFSPHPQSIMGYRSPAAEWIIIAFMFVAGANFALTYRTFRGEWGVFARDEEFRAYTGIVLLCSAAIVFFLGSGTDLMDRVRTALFQVISIITTTGFATADFALWNDQSRLVLLIVMFIGGCAGSAGGGPKVVRHLLIARYTLLELKRTVHPHGVLPVKLGGRVVPDDVMRGVLVFFLFYLLVFAVCTTLVIALGSDIMTGLTATIATLGNIGPGFNSVGPMGHFGDLHPIAKIVLTLAMWIGRLEVLPVLVLLRPEVWRLARMR
jgi:trk system potassium uptake protein TrkH